MADSSESRNLKALYSFYSNYLLNTLRRVFPSSRASAETSTAAAVNVYASSKRRRRKTGLPLPFPSTESLASLAGSSGSIKSEACRIFDALGDTIELLLQYLSSIQGNLDFWQSRAEGSNGRKAYFMIFERGPSAFLDGAVQLVRHFVSEGSSLQKVYLSASSHISERIRIFSSLRDCLATFLAKIYTELDALRMELVKHPENSLPLFFPIVSDLFLELEASLSHLDANHQAVDGASSQTLTFAKIPEFNVESRLTDSEIKDSINLIYDNLSRLDSYLSVLVSKHRKPGKLTLYWIHYSCGAFGVSLFSLWLFRHSKFMGSPDLGNWIRDAKESTKSFWNEHVEQPVLSIRDELFKTFRKRQKGAMELEEVQLTADSLHRMLLAFSEQATGKTFPETTPDQEMMKIVMNRYEKEITHPIKGLMSGELAHGLLIKVEKLKLDMEEAMLELDQILRANEINFAILAALPAFTVAILLGMLARTWLRQDRRAEGRGKVARIQRRLLLREIERGIQQCKVHQDQGLNNDAQRMSGITLCLVNTLHSVIERHAKATGEWRSLRKDIIELAKPDVPCEQKLHVAARMSAMYDCLLPASSRM